MALRCIKEPDLVSQCRCCSPRLSLADRQRGRGPAVDATVSPEPSRERADRRGPIAASVLALALIAWATEG